MSFLYAMNAVGQIFRYLVSVDIALRIVAGMMGAVNLEEKYGDIGSAINWYLPISFLAGQAYFLAAPLIR